MIKVEVIGAYVNEHGPGSIVEVDEKTANYLERIGYGKKLVETVKPEPKVKPKAKEKTKSKKSDK